MVNGGTELEKTARNLKFELLRNAFYHGDELWFFVTIERVAKLLSAMAGTAVVGYAIKQDTNVAFGLGFIIAFLQIAGLVFGWSARALLHESKRQRYFSLLSELESQPLPTAELLARIQSEMTRTWGEEPPPKWGVEAMAQNSAVMAMKSDSEIKPGDIIPVYFLERCVRYIWPFSSQHFRSRTTQAKRV